MNDPLPLGFRQLPRSLFVSCAITWLWYLSLLGLFLFFNVFYDTGSFALWALQCVPLLLFAPFLMKNSDKAYTGLSLLMLIYFVATVPEVMSPSTRWYEYAAMALSLLTFLSSIYSSRWIQRWQAYNKEFLNSGSTHE